MSDIGELTERLRAAHDAYTLAAREYNSARGAWLKAMPDAMNAEGVSASDCMAECVRAGHGIPSDFGFCRQALDQYEPCDCGLRGCPMDREPTIACSKRCVYCYAVMQVSREAVAEIRDVNMVCGACAEGPEQAETPWANIDNWTQEKNDHGTCWECGPLSFNTYRKGDRRWSVSGKVPGGVWSAITSTDHKTEAAAAEYMVTHMAKAMERLATDKPQGLVSPAAMELQREHGFWALPDGWEWTTEDGRWAALATQDHHIPHAELDRIECLVADRNAKDPPPSFTAEDYDMTKPVAGTPLGPVPAWVPRVDPNPPGADE